MTKRLVKPLVPPPIHWPLFENMPGPDKRPTPKAKSRIVVEPKPVKGADRG